MNFQHILLAFLIAISSFAAGFWLGPQYTAEPNPYLEALQDRDPALYRSRNASEQVVLDGDAGKVRAALLEADLLVRMSKLGELLSHLGKDSVDQVREAFDSVFLDVGDAELVLFAEWWARYDPHAALAWSETDWRTGHTSIVSQVLRSWGAIDPQAALVRAEQGRGPKALDKRRYLLAVISGWESADPLGALVFLQAMEAGTYRQRMMRGFARRLVLREDIEGAFGFVATLPDGDELFKLNVMRRVVSTAVRLDAPLMAKLVTTLQGGPYFRDIPQRIVIPWAATDAPAAVAWLKSLEDSDSRDNGVREVFGAWQKVDKEAAIEWLTGTEHEAWRDHALAPHARYVQLADKDKGIALAEQIIDPKLRKLTLTMIVRVWAKYDLEAAEKFAETQDWTENEHNRALAVAWRQRAWATGKLEEAEGIAYDQIHERMDRDLVPSDLEDPEDSFGDAQQATVDESAQ